MGGTCTFSARLNVSLNPHTVQVAAGGNLPDLRYVNVISAHITDWLASYAGGALEWGTVSRGATGCVAWRSETAPSETRLLAVR